jgi:xanthine dehydrogenase accessory factor
MSEIWEQLEHLRRTERRVVMATLVATRGTTPKKEGAKMWVGEGGRILGSVTIGGCVDARVIAEADEILASGEPRRLQISLGDEEAWDLGLTCSGSVDVLIESLSLDGDEDDDPGGYRRIRREVDAGRQAIAVVRVDRPGPRMIVLQDGTRIGSLDHGEALDQAAAARAHDVLTRGPSRTHPVEAEGNSHELFFEVHGPATHVYIFGATAVAVPLVELARGLGFRCTVVDARPRFASAERFADTAEILVGIPSEIAAGLPLGPSSAVILLAHDYKYDVPVLREVVGREDIGYVGLLGSRRRGDAILQFLREGGVPETALRRIHVPIGLDIGAESAAEIALSILAEVVAARAGRAGGRMSQRPGR